LAVRSRRQARESEPEFNLRVGVQRAEFAGFDIVPDLRRNDAIRAFLVSFDRQHQQLHQITETT
jgi:hypothetical protein